MSERCLHFRASVLLVYRGGLFLGWPASGSEDGTEGGNYFSII